MTTSTQERDILRLPTVKRIQKLQYKYSQKLQVPVQQIGPAVKHYRQIQSEFSHLDQYLSGCVTVSNSQTSNLGRMFQEYRTEVNQIHNDVRQWTLIYLNALLDTEASEDYRKQWRYRATIQHIRLGAQATWREWQNMELQRHTPNAHIKALLQMHARLQLTEGDFKGRDRMEFQKVTLQRIIEGMREAFRRHQYRLRHRFETVLYTESTLDHCLKANPSKAEFQELDGRWMGKWRQFIHDHVYGYTPATSEYASITQKSFDQVIYPQMDQIRRGRLRRHVARALTIGVVLAFLTVVLNMTGWDQVLMRSGRMLARDIMSITWLFPEHQEKSPFFQKELENFHVGQSRVDLEKNLRTFIYQGGHWQANSYTFFAERILKTYLILLAAEELPPSATTDIYRAAFLLNPDLVSIIERLSSLYAQPIVRESNLRDIIFDLRRLFVRHDVYPFLFLTVYENAPYVFLYSERIIDSMPLLESDVESLGIDTFWFKHVNQRKLKAYMMRGDNYPFEGKAGFFEGEFAVVFTSLSTRPEWTGWHELGHVVDYMLYTHMQVLPLDNVEVTAVLFPMIFAEDPIEYIERHLFPTVDRRDRKDYYVQSAKGILNGFTMYLNERRDRDDVLITDRFEQDRIAEAKERLLELKEDQIRGISRIIYTRPYKYLSTAKRAKYRSVEGDAEEIIYGVHGSAQREVIDLAPLGSIFSGNSSTRFLRDGDGAGDDTDALKRAAMIRAILVFVIFELCAVLLHMCATPIRRWKMFGRKPDHLVKRMFKSRWSQSGKHGDHSQTAQSLLSSIHDTGYSKGDLFLKRIDRFRLNANHKERFLFHAGLSLAPTIPERSIIKNEMHRLLFYLPFIGPFLARQRWIFRRQRPFFLRERYNQRIQNLITQSAADASTQTLTEGLQQTMSEFETQSANAQQAAQSRSIDFDKLEQWVLAYLDKVYGHIRLNYDGRWMELSHLSKAMDHGTEFDRLDRYVPGDDIRMIDWNVTARSTSGQAMVRKRIIDEDVQVAFLYDMTTLNTTINQKKWASDLAKSIRAVGQNNHLKTVIYLYPDGKSLIKPVKLHSKLHYKNLAVKLVRMIQKEWERSSDHFQVHRYRGLKFYNDEENRRFRQQLNWLSFDVSDQQPVLKHLKIQNHTIFMIGTKPQKKKLIARMLNQHNKAVFW